MDSLIERTVFGDAYGRKARPFSSDEALTDRLIASLTRTGRRCVVGLGSDAPLLAVALEGPGALLRLGIRCTWIEVPCEFDDVLRSFIEQPADDARRLLEAAVAITTWSAVEETRPPAVCRASLRMMDARGEDLSQA